ncbi:unnamed protein product, partial [Rotaria socialis]
TSSHSNTTQQTSSVPDRKRPYNVSVDPARYRRVPDPDDATAVKFACSLCGNLYKWRKSLNKHWKEKHNDESPPPLDAPVTIRPPKSSANTNIQSKLLNRTSDILPQSSMNPPASLAPPPPPAPHHPAFPFNPYSWINFASRNDFQPIYPSVTPTDQSLNLPLDLTIKSTNKTTTTTSSPISIEQNPLKKHHRDSSSSNEEQRDSSHYNRADSD